MEIRNDQADERVLEDGLRERERERERETHLKRPSSAAAPYSHLCVKSCLFSFTKLFFRLTGLSCSTGQFVTLT